MRTPSIKALQQHLGVDVIKAREIKKILTAARIELESMPAGAARVAECWHPPETWDVRLTCLNQAMEGHGVECFKTERDGWCEYVNTGDTYSPTILRFKGHYRVATWGDIAERFGAH